MVSIVRVIVEDYRCDQVDQTTASAKDQKYHKSQANQGGVEAKELGDPTTDTGDLPVPAALVQPSFRGAKTTHTVLYVGDRYGSRSWLRRCGCVYTATMKAVFDRQIDRLRAIGYSCVMGQRKTTPANRERIIATAAKLIRERGIGNTTLADIAVAAEISKGTLYYYYSTKGDLIFDVAERHMTNMTDRIFRWLESSGSDLPPRKVFRMVFDTALHSKSRGLIHIYLIQEALTENPSLRKRFVEEYRKWRSMVEEGLTRLYRDNRDHSTMARTLLYAIDGMIMQRLLGVDRLSVDEIAEFFEVALSTS